MTRTLRWEPGFAVEPRRVFTNVNRRFTAAVAGLPLSIASCDGRSLLRKNLTKISAKTGGVVLSISPILTYDAGSASCLVDDPRTSADRSATPARYGELLVSVFFLKKRKRLPIAASGDTGVHDVHSVSIQSET